MKGCPFCRNEPNSLPCVNDQDYNTKIRRISAGLPQDGTGKSFENWNHLGKPKVSKALLEVQRFAGEPKGLLVLAGPRGTGKTHLALAVAEQRIAEESPVLYSKIPRLLMRLRTSLSAQPPAMNYQETFDIWANTPMAIFDDLGQERDSDWVQESLLLLLDMRYESRTPTIITTNLDGQGIKDRYGYALFDRLTDIGTGITKQIQCNWESYRQQEENVHRTNTTS